MIIIFLQMSVCKPMGNNGLVNHSHSISSNVAYIMVYYQYALEMWRPVLYVEQLLSMVAEKHQAWMCQLRERFLVITKSCSENIFKYLGRPLHLYQSIFEQVLMEEIHRILVVKNKSREHFSGQLLRPVKKHVHR